MNSLQNKPSFLKNAKLIEDERPDFLKNAKLIEAPEEDYISDEQIQKDIERNIGQQTARGLEAVAGLPGDLINFARGLMGLESSIPGSQELRGLSNELSGGYLEPQNENEESAGELIQDISLFALPGAKEYSIARNIGIPVVSNLIKEGMKFGGGDEKKQSYAKIGSMILMDVLNHRKAMGSAKEYSGKLFQEADAMVPEGLSIEAKNLKNSLNSLESSLKMGGERPSTAEALKKISELKNEIKNGKGNLKSVLAYRPSINELIDKFKGFEYGGENPAIRKKIIHNLNDVKKEVIKFGQEYGHKYDPEYLKKSNMANESWAAYSESNKITNFIQKHAGNKILSNAAKALLLGASGAGGVLAPVPVLAGTGAYKIFKTILRSRDPTLRNHYFNIIKGAAAGDAATVVKNAKALDKSLSDMDKTGEINHLLEE